MAIKDTNKKKFRQKLIDKYRMVIINEDTFEEKFSFKLSRLNVFIFGSFFTILLIGLTSVLIAFTPIKEYIPGYASTKLKKQATDLVFKVDSLENIISVNSLYINKLKNVLTGDVNYDINLKHYALDIAVKTGTPVKAISDGTVIFAEWTAETGHVIILEHAKGFISVYKHNGGLHKQQGDLVKSGEVIASSGSTGELSTGPHLHFELWNDGYPVNPINFIDFE